jgi:type IX secretion system PorP/SprF family membrane protein
MKKLLAVVTASCLSTLVLAQQDPQFSQNMFNRLYVNPAYAGSSEAICASGIFRSQWVNYDGAPKTGVFNIDAPLANDKIGVGLSFSNDQLGFEKTNWVKLAGAYRFDVGSGKLAIGVDFDYLQHEIDGDFRAPSTVDDPAIPANGVNGGVFDMGAGIYYNSEKVYAGISSTHLMESAVELDKFSKEFKRHYYGMFGMNFEVSPMVVLRPMIFVKNVTDNTTFDVNLNAHFNERFWLGASYRNEDAIVVLAGVNITEKLRLGYSYDITTSDVKDYSSGTHEFMLGYCFNVKKKITPVIKNVRFL